MINNSEIHCRRPIRLRQYDYSQTGAYFITVCTYNRNCLFGKIINGRIELNDAAKVVNQCWLEIPNHFLDIQVDEFVIMPNHLHGIIMKVGARFIVPNDLGFDKSNPYIDNNPMMTSLFTLGKIIRAFKARTSHIIRTTTNLSHFKWQRNYYEHIIRNEDELNRIREYIINNPLQWEYDRENVRRISNKANQWQALEEVIYGKTEKQQP